MILRRHQGFEHYCYYSIILRLVSMLYCVFLSIGSEMLIIPPLGKHQSATRKTVIRIKERTNPKRGTHQSTRGTHLPDEAFSCLEYCFHCFRRNGAERNGGGSSENGGASRPGISLQRARPKRSDSHMIWKDQVAAYLKITVNIREKVLTKSRKCAAKPIRYIHLIGGVFCAEIL